MCQSCMQGNPGQLQPNLEARLSEQQKQTLLINHALLLLLGGKTDACQEHLQHLKARSPSSLRLTSLPRQLNLLLCPSEFAVAAGQQD